MNSQPTELPKNSLAALSGHHAATEPHLPAATLVTHDVKDVHNAEAVKAVEPGMSEPQHILAVGQAGSHPAAATTTTTTTIVQQTTTTPAAAAAPAALLSGHHAATEPHLPAATLVTHDVKDVHNVSAVKAVEPGMSELSHIDPVTNKEHEMQLAAKKAHEQEILKEFPAPTHGQDVTMAAHAKMLATDIQKQGATMMAEASAAIKTAPTAMRDTFEALKNKASEMKQQHFPAKTEHKTETQ